MCLFEDESFLAQDRVKNSSKFCSREAGSSKCLEFPQENVLNYESFNKIWAADSSVGQLTDFLKNHLLHMKGRSGEL